MLQFIELSTKKVRSITLHVNVENEILGKNTLWPRWLVCPQPSCPGWGGPVCSPLVSKMGQGWLCLPRLTHGESLPRGGESGCQAAGRWAVGTRLWALSGRVWMGWLRHRQGLGARAA